MDMKYFCKCFLGAVFVLAGTTAWMLLVCNRTTRVRAADAPTTTSSFQPTIPNPIPAGLRVTAGMVWIPGGNFSMGSASDSMPDAQPIHRVYVDGFWMDKTDVTNEEFEKFVKATGYVTVAEKKPRPEDFPGVPLEKLIAGAIVFRPPQHPVSLDNPALWWSYVPGANWRHPTGPGSSIKGREHFPVVQVAYADAVAYAKWAGKRLPTEAEWEFAARGGKTGKLYVWGNQFRPHGKWMANTYQGNFPNRNTGLDGYSGIAPVGKYPPNGYGLYDMAGNVWQWVGDWYRPDYYAQLAAKGIARNPQGPDSSYDPMEPGARKRVQRGGSFLCTAQYCSRYMVGARGKGEISSASNHIGFRCVMGLTEHAKTSLNSSTLRPMPANLTTHSKQE